MDISTAITFCPMQRCHLDQVISIEQTSFTTPWSRESFLHEIEHNDFSLYLVALHNGMVVGYAGVWLVLDEAHITNVAIHPLYRGNGIGRAVMLEIINSAALLGSLRMTLEVRPTNKTAIELYRSLGFEESGIRKSYYSDTGEDALIMWKEPLVSPAGNE